MLFFCPYHPSVRGAAGGSSIRACHMITSFTPASERIVYTVIRLFLMGIFSLRITLDWFLQDNTLSICPRLIVDVDLFSCQVRGRKFYIVPTVACHLTFIVKVY